MTKSISAAVRKTLSVAGCNKVQKVSGVAGCNKVRKVSGVAGCNKVQKTSFLATRNACPREIFDFRKLILNCSTGPQE